MKAVAGLLVALIVLAVLVLLAGEFLAKPAAEEVIGSHLAANYGLPRRPRVRMQGFPFVVRALRGRLDAVEVILDDHVAEGLRVKTFTLRLEPVTFQLVPLLRGTGPAMTERGDAAAALRDSDLTSYLRDRDVPVTVSFSARGVTVSGRVSVAGVATDVAATGRLAVSERALRFTPETARAGPEEVDLRAVRDLFSFVVPIPEILGVRLTSLVVREGEAGLSADVTDYLISRTGGRLTGLPRPGGVVPRAPAALSPVADPPTSGPRQRYG